MEKDDKNNTIHDKISALDFLTKNSIIPSDEFLSDDLSDLYDDLFEYIGEHPADEYIPIIVSTTG